VADELPVHISRLGRVAKASPMTLGPGVTASARRRRAGNVRRASSPSAQVDDHRGRLAAGGNSSGRG
jgi:hypothetical protein